MKSPSSLMSFALELAASGSGEILPRFPVGTMDYKKDGSVVTDADRAAERAMRERIKKTYPSHGVLGEEEEEFIGSEKLQWILDPLDGTRAFTLGVPMFGILIGLLEQGMPRLGVIHLPVTNETLYAETGKGCWYTRGKANPTQVFVDDTVWDLKNATLSLWGVDGSEFRRGTTDRRYHLQGILHTAQHLEFLGGCVQHFLVAKGDLHAALDAVMHPWDIAAVVPCIREAGGVVSTLDGDYEDVVFGGSLLSSCNRELHEEVIHVLNRKENR
jgi:histidinol-phosphatase